MGTISDILASCTSATLPILFQGSPESVLLASVLPPLLSKAFNAIGDDLLKKNLTQKEMKILGISYAYAINTIKENRDKGLALRTDNLFIEGVDENSKVEDILESTFKNAINDYEDEKSKFYGYFIGNLPFASEIGYSYSFTIQRIIRNLSYKELCIIRYFNDNGILKLQKFDSFKNDGLNIEKNEMAFYFKNLLSLGVIHKSPPMTMHFELDNMKLSPLGNNICTLLNLQEIDRKEIELIGMIITKHQ